MPDLGSVKSKTRADSSAPASAITFGRIDDVDIGCGAVFVAERFIPALLDAADLILLVVAHENAVKCILVQLFIENFSQSRTPCTSQA